MNLVVYGTRPEEIKLYPFTKYPEFKFVQVDQSPDLHQELIKPDYTLKEDDFEAFLAGVFEEVEPKTVIVQGDTRTAFRAAVKAFEYEIPVVHIEAGLRTYDLTQPFPEEGYRQMIDRIATHRFCSTEEAVKNLESEGLSGLYVGQTGIDTLMEFADPTDSQDPFWIVTVHRNEADMPKVVERLKKFQNITQGVLKIFAHPNKQGQELRKHFDVLEPLPYREFVRLLSRCIGVITDSGGLQEEAMALGKKVISLREKTERGHGETYEPGATRKIVNELRRINS